MTKQELIAKIDTLEISEDTKISLMEDISDLEMEGTEVNTEELDGLKAEVESLKAEVESVKAKYKERFMSGCTEEKEEKEEIVDDVIDIKEI